MQTIDQLDISGKKVLMRVDFNVPLNDRKEITDDTRIRGVLPTIRYALEQNAALILLSHCGRPKGERNPKFSMAPAAAGLAALLEKEVKLAGDCVGPLAEEAAAAVQPGEVLLLENLRFHQEETQNDPQFAAQLGALGKVYINDAFAVSHRAHASVAGITKHVKRRGAGFLLQKEMDFFERSVSQAASPLIAILGGAKVSTKLGAIRHMLDRVDKMIIGGAMANTFLKSRGLDMGSSLVEDDLLETASELLALGAEKGVEILLPVDGVTAKQFSEEAPTQTASVEEIQAGRMVLDIGPASAKLFCEALEGAKTIVWNGPMGAFEMAPFAKGSLALAQALAKSSALTVVGGGDTNALINQAGIKDDVSYMSTGGGAFLQLMEGKTLPGVTSLED